MTDREYPRWVHRPGVPKDSVVVETAEEEAQVVAGWSAGRSSSSNALTRELTSTKPASHGDELILDSAPARRKGGWPKGKPRPARNVAVN